MKNNMSATHNDGTFDAEFSRSDAIKAEYLASACSASDVDYAVNRLMKDCPSLFENDREVVFHFPTEFGYEVSRIMWLRLELHGFHPEWDYGQPGVRSISLPANEVEQLRLFQTQEPRIWGTHPQVQKEIEARVDVKLKSLPPGQGQWVGILYKEARITTSEALVINEELHALSAVHMLLCEKSLKGLNDDQEKARDNVEALIGTLLRVAPGVKGASFSYDPSGSTVGIKFESGVYNSFLDGGCYKVPLDEAHLQSLRKTPYWADYVDRGMPRQMAESDGSDDDATSTAESPAG